LEAETEQLAPTVAPTVKVEVLVVNARADVEARARNPRTAAGTADLIVFVSFIVMTPHTAQCEN
jgi:hypothetical protein